MAKIEKIGMSITYRGEVYVGNFIEYSKETEADLNEMAINIAKSSMEYIQMNCGDDIRFFPKKVLLKSVISIIKR